MKKVLVTGISGQVGYEVAKILSDRYDVVSSGHNAIGVCSIDLADGDSIRQGMGQVRPDIIVNCAAYTQVDKAEGDRSGAFQVNAEAPGIFAEEARKLGSLLIHFSTDYVFDGAGDQPHCEGDALAPLNVYGESKLAGEQAIVDSGCDYIILRTSWVFSDRGHNFVKTMLRLGKEREELSIVADQIGAPTSALTLARAVDGVLRVMSANPAREFNGIYHCTSAGETSWHGFATEIFQQARSLGMTLAVRQVKGVPTSAYPTPAQRPLNSRLDCSKFVRTFSCPLPSWQEALREVMASLLVLSRQP